jgi:hypothetical protein
MMARKRLELTPEQLAGAKVTTINAAALGVAPAPRANKFNAVRTPYKGRTYDSKREAAYARQLDLEVEAREVLWWIPQVTVPLGEDDSLRVDFLVARWERFTAYPGVGAVAVHAVDVKGVTTRDFARRAKLWRKYGPFPLHVVRKGDTEIIAGGRG